MSEVLMIPGTMGYEVEADRIEKKIASLKAFGVTDIAKQLSAEEYKFHWSDKLAKWNAAKLALAEAKELEMNLRKDFVALVVPAGTYGTHHFDLGDGYDAKSVTAINYGFVKAKGETGEDANVDKAAIDAALSRLEARSPVDAYIAAKLIKWTPALSVSTYKELNAEQKAIIDPVLVKKDKAPTLEIVAPKGKR